MGQPEVSEEWNEDEGPRPDAVSLSLTTDAGDYIESDLMAWVWGPWDNGNVTGGLLVEEGEYLRFEIGRSETVDFFCVDPSERTCRETEVDRFTGSELPEETLCSGWQQGRCDPSEVLGLCNASDGPVFLLVGVCPELDVGSGGISTPAQLCEVELEGTWTAGDADCP